MLYGSKCSFVVCIAQRLNASGKALNGLVYIMLELFVICSPVIGLL